jgi:hypothetical protein
MYMRMCMCMYLKEVVLVGVVYLLVFSYSDSRYSST